MAKTMRDRQARCRLRRRHGRLAVVVLTALLPIASTTSASAAGVLLPSPVATPLSIPVAVFGKDDRTALPAGLQRYQEALGLLFNTRSRTVCTAFCVAPGVIATAAHCIYRTAGETPPKLADFWFARNYDKVKDYAPIAGHNTGAASQNVLAGSSKLSLSPPIDATHDWALIRLSRPACKTTFGVNAMTPDEIVRQSQRQKLFQLAYHRDITPWRAAYSTPCASARTFETADAKTIAADFSQPEALVLHTCDTGGASSGSPLLVETADGPRVVGINVGTYVQSKVLVRDGEVVQKSKSDAVANTGVASSAFAERLENFAAARILMTAVEIKDLQRRLADHGDYAGPLDGTYGPALKAAIEAYEARQQLSVNGFASQALLEHLRKATAGKRQ